MEDIIYFVLDVYHYIDVSHYRDLKGFLAIVYYDHEHEIMIEVQVLLIEK